VELVKVVLVPVLLLCAVVASARRAANCAVIVLVCFDLLLFTLRN
jgi:hypothetical protein